MPISEHRSRKTKEFKGVQGYSHHHRDFEATLGDMRRLSLYPQSQEESKTDLEAHACNSIAGKAEA